MTELQRYLAEEVAEDLSDGIITRREAMRRLGLLGVSGAAAATMLSATASDAVAARPPIPGGRGGPKPKPAPAAKGKAHGRSSSWAPAATEAITFPGPNGTLMGPTPASAGVRGARCSSSTRTAA
jgi:carboxymethylenebutenolidase